MAEERNSRVINGRMHVEAGDGLYHELPISMDEARDKTRNPAVYGLDEHGQPFEVQARGQYVDVMDLYMGRLSRDLQAAVKERETSQAAMSSDEYWADPGYQDQVTKTAEMADARITEQIRSMAILRHDGFVTPEQTDALFGKAGKSYESVLAEMSTNDSIEARKQIADGYEKLGEANPVVRDKAIEQSKAALKEFDAQTSQIGGMRMYETTTRPMQAEMAGGGIPSIPHGGMSGPVVSPAAMHGAHNIQFEQPHTAGSSGKTLGSMPVEPAYGRMEGRLDADTTFTRQVYGPDAKVLADQLKAMTSGQLDDMTAYAQKNGLPSHGVEVGPDAYRVASQLAVMRENGLVNKAVAHQLDGDIGFNQVLDDMMHHRDDKSPEMAEKLQAIEEGMSKGAAAGKGPYEAQTLEQQEASGIKEMKLTVDYSMTMADLPEYSSGQIERVDVEAHLMNQLMSERKGMDPVAEATRERSERIAATEAAKAAEQERNRAIIEQAKAAGTYQPPAGPGPEATQGQWDAYLAF